MLTYTLVNDVAVLHIDDGKANAVSHAFIEAVNGGLDRATDEAKAVVIQGRDGVFSAGFDLKEIQKGAEQAAALAGAGGKLLLRLFQHPQPVVAAAGGHDIPSSLLIEPAIR